MERPYTEIITRFSIFRSHSGKNKFVQQFIIPEKMAKLIEQPEQFKTELKDKWLDYYQINRNWLQSFMNKNSSWANNVKYEGELEDPKYTPRRPNAHFILGIVTVLEPQTQGWLALCPHLQTDPNLIVKALNLDFDPELELEKRSQQQQFQKLNKKESQYLDKIREEIKT